MKFMVEKGIKEFCFYSDNCGGQNRNRFIGLFLQCGNMQPLTSKLRSRTDFWKRDIPKMRVTVCTRALKMPIKGN